MVQLAPILLTLIAASYWWGLGHSQTFPSKETVQRWASKLDQTFYEITSGKGDLTNARGLQEAYKANLENVEINHADGKAIIEKLAADIGEHFRKNIEALKKLQQGAEAATEDYEYDEDLVLPRVNYVNMNDLKNASGQLEPSRHFGQDISRQQSGVHIPIEIYEGYNPIQMTKICPTCTSVCDLCQNNLFWRQESRFAIQETYIIRDPEILNGIRWTQALDSVFKENQKAFPDIYWQTFGSQDGYMRVFPTTRWRTFGDLPDLYDVRRRPWYIHGSVSPKDVVILLDTSGSMHGQSLDIMKLAAKTMMNTLGEDDFVNVAQFARNVSWVTPCLTSLVQANSRNKRLLFDGIDNLVDHQIANYSQALEFAYKAHEAFEQNRSRHDGAECHKLVMVFSDGGTEYPRAVIEKYSDPSKAITRDVRIFTYAVGPHPLPTVALKSMACSTGGSFSTIIAMGAIRTKIQSSYIGVLARPVVLNNEHVLAYSSVYSDVLGLGLVTTITLPVFNKSASSDNQTLAGVVGIDIPTTKFEEMTPFHKLGPNGYSFGINQNGFLVFHPFLWMNVNFLEEPTHIDMADVEGSSQDVDELREAMINQPAQAQMKEITNPMDLEDRYPLVGITKEYHYLTVGDSSFTSDDFCVGVVLDKGWNYAIIKDQDLSAIANLDPKSALIAPWRYCQENKVDIENTLETMKADIKAQKCSGEVVEHLAWDLKVAKSWFDRLSTDFLANRGILSQFVMTDGGLTLANPPDALDGYFQLRNPYNSSLFRKATLEPGTPVLHVTKFLVKEIVPVVQDTAVTDDQRFGKKRKPDRHKEVLTKIQPSTVHVAKAIQIESPSGLRYIPGIVGVELEHDFLQELLMNATEVEPESSELGCQNSTELICTLVDHEGNILGSNQPMVELGDFLGTIDPQLMKHLVEYENIFVENVETNYQALCPDAIDCSFGARSIFIPTLDSIFHLIRWIVSSLQSLGYVPLSLLSVPFLSETSDALSEYSFRMPEGMHRCSTNTSYWALNSKLVANDFHQRISGEECKECKRDYHLYTLENINSLLIVSEPQCANCHVPSYKDKPIEVDPAQESCNLPKRYRKRPSKCFSRHDQEIPECSAASLTSSSWLKIILALMPVVVATLLLI
ncbi:voltage-dependent calcium channel subunit alpha-2/delta-2-like isoform X2 [Tigriopus californicus]|uniref:voltage-dependent calcium channel subunit alpha-2/delta-2-like isoform X2 n=1 Tax=Tigriopus californicus TaxID=6832 RepID=UPI0027DA1995|nr:voltage-dependent calcium channel subunit alpha-2/delta-2-like isoform X2 [Tigriopus californicus]